MHLNLLTNNTRFLIPSWVKIPCIASHILGKVIRRLPDDWQRRYGTSVVLLETFVDRSQYLGTSYQAANFLHIGHTQGRSRQDRYGRLRVPIKDIYVYPLRRDFRRHLGNVTESKQLRKGLNDCGEAHHGECSQRY